MVVFVMFFSCSCLEILHFCLDTLLLTEPGQYESESTGVLDSEGVVALC